MGRPAKWRSGPPPSIGWWPASTTQIEGVLRWWNGKRWSVGVFDDCNSRKAGRMSQYISNAPTHKIQWRNRPSSWPARSRT